MPEVIRTSWKARANRLEVKLTHALRRAEWAEKEAKAAKYDLAFIAFLLSGGVMLDCFVQFMTAKHSLDKARGYGNSYRIYLWSPVVIFAFWVLWNSFR